MHRHKFHTRINSIKKNQQSATGIHNKERDRSVCKCVIVCGGKPTREKLTATDAHACWNFPRFPLAFFLFFFGFSFLFFFESGAAASTVSSQSQRHCHKMKLNGEQEGERAQ